MAEEIFTTVNSSGVVDVNADPLESLVSAESFSDRILETALVINKYYTPLIALIGILGNSLSVGVFCIDPKYRTQSASIYLSSLAISDTGFLLSLLTIWLEQILPGGGILTLSDLSCSLVMYLGQVTCFLSVYLQLAFSIERFVAVRCPFSRPRICTRAKAKRCVAILTMTALLIFSYAWLIAKVIKFPTSTSDVPNSHEEGGNVTRVKSNFSSESDVDSGFNISNIIGVAVDDDDGDDGYDDSSAKYICTVPEQYYKVSEIANYIDTVITLIIPFFLISFFNIQIARSVLDLKGQRKNIVAMTRIPSRKHNAHQKKKKKTDSDVTCHYIAKTNSVQMDVLNKRFHKSSNNGNNLMLKKGLSPCQKKYHNRMNMEDEDENDIDIDRRKSSPGAPTTLELKPVSRATFKSRLSIASPSPSERRSPSPSRCPYSSPEVRVAKTLLLVSTVFLALNLPSHVIRCAQFIQIVTGSQEGNHFLHALQPWSHILFNTSFAVNFLLYCLSGKNFRLSLNNLCLRMWRRNLNHNQGRLINGRLNPAASRSRCCSQTFSTATAGGGGGVGNSAYLRIELGTTTMAVEHHQSSSFRYSGSGSCLNLMTQEAEQIVPV